MSATALDTTTEVHSATADAPAKLNLTLDILRRRDDGFHELRSLVAGVDLCDRVTCRFRPQTGIALRCSDPALGGEENLAHRAATRLAERYRVQPALDIELQKAIPIGAGLGGGSSDAAATLRLCSELWKTGLDRSHLADLGAEIGSDVPLFFFLPSAVMTGRGERVKPVALGWSGWALLAFAATPVSTAEVYQAWRQSDAAERPSGMDEAILEAGSADQIMPLLSNHLEPAVFRVAPMVARVHAELDRLGVGPMRVSGAGSALFRLFDTCEAAREAAMKIENHEIDTRTLVVAAPYAAGRVRFVCEEC